MRAFGFYTLLKRKLKSDKNHSNDLRPALRAFDFFIPIAAYWLKMKLNSIRIKYIQSRTSNIAKRVVKLQNMGYLFRKSKA